MKENFKVEVNSLNEIYSFENYDIVLELTNQTKQTFEDIQVIPQVLPKYLIEEQLAENIEEQELIQQKNVLIKEMELQTKKAYEQKILSKMSKRERFFAMLQKVFIRVFSGLPYFNLLTSAVVSAQDEIENGMFIPNWAKQATKIKDWQDVEVVEKEYINIESTSEFLKKAFRINKEKLKRIHDSLEKTENKGNDLSIKYTLEPNSTISFPFKAKSPFVFKERNYPFHFQITATERENKKTINTSKKGELKIIPTAYTITLGVILGAVLGFISKRGLLENSTWFSSAGFWTDMVVSIFIGLILSWITVKSKDKNKPIVVSDFVGGLIIGALGGLFTENIINILKEIVTKL